MSEVREFRLPDVGEGLTEAEIVSWKVKTGDVVAVNDVVVEIETAKSLVELPVPFAGTVAGLLVPEGETVPVGTPIIAVQVGVAAASADGSPADGAPEAAPEVGGGAEDLVPSPPAGGATPREEAKREAVLVGYGVRQGPATRRARKTAAASGPPPAAVQGLNEAFKAPAEPSPAAPDRPVGDDQVAAAAALPGADAPDRPAADDQVTVGRGVAPVLAKPPVRKLAKDLGVDLAALVASGPGGVVTREDVQQAHARATAPAPAGAPYAPVGAPTTAPAAATGAAPTDAPREERIPIKSVRKATAAAVTASAFTAPHVTEFLTVDVTRTMRLVERLRASREFDGVRLSPLAVLAKAVCIAARRTPEVNSHWDEAAQEIVLKRYVNLGIAAATPRGLVVPNIKDADRLGLRELAVAINELAATAREGRTPPGDMVGGTLSITNVGVFGVDSGTPILPPGEALIVAFGAVKQQPWVHKGRVVPRWVTTLAVSFDHRLVDGEQGSRFLADLGAVLQDPAQALVWS